MHNTLDMALRYHPIVTYLRPRLETGTRVLEVGSGSAGITPYLQHRVFGVDHNFDGPPSSRLVRCTGDVLKLPFPDRAVDFTLCVDTLEHIPPGKRATAIKELLRVTRHAAVIAVPCGPLAAQHDRDLSVALRRRLAKRDRFVDEHLEHGLPTIDNLRRWTDEAAVELGRPFHTKNHDNVHLRIWWLVQMAKISLVWRALLILSFPVLFPLFRSFNGPPSYRQIVFVEAWPVPRAGVRTSL